MALAAALTLPLYDLSFSVMEELMRGLARSETGYTLFNLSGAAVAAMVMLPATFFAGMTLPLLTSALLRRGAGEAAIGEAYAANTIGAIAGVVLAVHFLLPVLGLKGALVVGSAVDAALGIVLLRRYAAGRWIPAVAAVAAVAMLAWTTLFVHLDANKMTAGVFRHGEIAASSDAEVLYARDGKTATVHLVRYDEATSLRTNGKSDGSINLDPGTERGSDEITMVLTAGLPLALKPDARTAAVIGIGTGLTTHTLLQSLDIERVDTIEIEPAMAEAARGFLPRNSGAFADPRGSIVVDDAKSYFAAGHRRYDLIISEPSNPWVSGVSSLFTREFYRRVQGHLAEGGILVQWFQLYEIGPSLVASVMGALGEVFPHYAVFAPSDHDLLIMASREPLPLPPKPQVFEHPGLAKELWTVHVLSAGDLDARYLGERRTLEPLFASYGMPLNSDYAPVLDNHAARHRFMERSAASLVALLNAEIPLMELLDPQRSRRPINPLFQGAYAFERVENARLARYGLSYLLESRPPVPEGVPMGLQKDLELVKLRLIECRAPRDLDAWLSSALRVAKALNPHLAPEHASAAWRAISAAPCFGALRDFQRQWVRLFQAVAARDAGRMAELAAPFLADGANAGTEAREYLVMAAMAGLIASGRKGEALAVWDRHHGELRNEAQPPFRLLRCHAEQHGPAGCAAAFSDYAER
jgi:spermidine synthase